jgi:GntR family transcriptional repressor for pyruvate dehydrogenase complex
LDKINYSVTKTNLYEQVADTLERAIIKSELKAEKLPSEQELSKRFQVSRTVIREALKVLKERGLIESRNGEGSYISKPNTDTVSSVINRIIRMDNISDDDLHSTRLILETAGARLAAAHIQSADVEHLEYILKQMADKSLPLDERIGYDADFHISIARAGGNGLVGMFVEVMTILLKDYMSKGFLATAQIKQTLSQHRRVLEAIKNRKPDEAENAIYDHLVAARGDVGKYKPKKKAGKTGAKKVSSGG